MESCFVYGILVKFHILPCLLNKTSPDMQTTPKFHHERVTWSITGYYLMPKRSTRSPSFRRRGTRPYSTSHTSCHRCRAAWMAKKWAHYIWPMGSIDLLPNTSRGNSIKKKNRPTTSGTLSLPNLANIAGERLRSGLAARRREPDEGASGEIERGGESNSYPCSILVCIVVSNWKMLCVKDR
jgi:hypothetical protein